MENNETWKDVIGYEGFYKVSSHGKVKILYDRRKYKKGRILKMYDNCGYKRVWLYKNDHEKRMLVHRIVASAFIDNINNKPFVNHINSNRADNNVHNLEWCTASENFKHAYLSGRVKFVSPSIGKFGHDNHRSKIVYQYDLEGNLISIHGGVRQAARDTKIGHRSIQYCCVGKYKKAGGFKWSYTNDIN